MKKNILNNKAMLRTVVIVMALIVLIWLIAFNKSMAESYGNTKELKLPEGWLIEKQDNITRAYKDGSTSYVLIEKNNKGNIDSIFAKKMLEVSKDKKCSKIEKKEDFFSSNYSVTCKNENHITVLTLSGNPLWNVLMRYDSVIKDLGETQQAMLYVLTNY